MADAVVADDETCGRDLDPGLAGPGVPEDIGRGLSYRPGIQDLMLTGELLGAGGLRDTGGDACGVQRVFGIG